LPVPLLPLVTVSHEALLEVVHAHPAVAVTVTAPVPPEAGTDALEGVRAALQDGVAAAWSTRNVWPPIVMVADRAMFVVFGTTE
jgi:hypothetical protein